MQLVLVNNRIMAYGENFLAMGGVVINTETGARYENATIAEHDCVPSDIGQVGYEYHAGNFIPCAPYGKGVGNVPVLCGSDCKAIKDSGIALSSFCLIEKKPYVGVGTMSVTLTFNHSPTVVFVHNDAGETYRGVIHGNGGTFIFCNNVADPVIFHADATISGNMVTWSGNNAQKICNYNKGTYEAIALCLKGE